MRQCRTGRGSRSSGVELEAVRLAAGFQWLDALHATRSGLLAAVPSTGAYVARGKPLPDHNVGLRASRLAISRRGRVAGVGRTYFLDMLAA